jgi:hypothetical protein
LFIYGFSFLRLTTTLYLDCGLCREESEDWICMVDGLRDTGVSMDLFLLVYGRQWNEEFGYVEPWVG